MSDTFCLVHPHACICLTLPFCRTFSVDNIRSDFIKRVTLYFLLPYLFGWCLYYAHNITQLSMDRLFGKVVDDYPLPCTLQVSSEGKLWQTLCNPYTVLLNKCANHLGLLLPQNTASKDQQDKVYTNTCACIYNV